MIKLLKVEYAILLVLWCCVLTTFPIAILNDFSLFLSDFMGLIGLSLVTIVAVFFRKNMLFALTLLLFLGLFNILSFVYFVNFVFSFGVLQYVTPGIQVFSLFLLLILFVRRPVELVEKLKKVFSNEKGNESAARQARIEKFKMKFSNLTEKDIEVKLRQELVDEAKLALLEIQSERKGNNETTNF